MCCFNDEHMSAHFTFSLDFPRARLEDSPPQISRKQQSPSLNGTGKHFVYFRLWMYDPYDRIRKTFYTHYYDLTSCWKHLKPRTNLITSLQGHKVQVINKLNDLIVRENTALECLLAYVFLFLTFSIMWATWPLYYLSTPVTYITSKLHCIILPFHYMLSIVYSMWCTLCQKLWNYLLVKVLNDL